MKRSRPTFVLLVFAVQAECLLRPQQPALQAGNLPRPQPPYGRSPLHSSMRSDADAEKKELKIPTLIDASHPLFGKELTVTCAKMSRAGKERYSTGALVPDSSRTPTTGVGTQICDAFPSRATRTSRHSLTSWSTEIRLSALISKISRDRRG